VGGLSVTGLAAPSRGAAQTIVWRLAIARGTDGFPHTVDREEVFVALAGAAVATVGDRTFPLAAGDALVVPPGEVFALANPHDVPFEAVAALPVGGRARALDGDPFTPPWTE
jgi:mannose-6-phosphate isomerase-like protein (cupin superfamily)